MRKTGKKLGRIFCVLLAASSLAALLWSGAGALKITLRGTATNKTGTGVVRGRLTGSFAAGQRLSVDSSADYAPGVENLGSVDLLARVKAVARWGVENEGPFEEDTTLSGANVRPNYDLEGWVYNSEDGYFYYRKALAPGEKSAPLFDSLKVDGLVTGNEYSGKIGELELRSDFVQAGANGADFWGISLEDLEINYQKTVPEPPVATVSFEGFYYGFKFSESSGDLFTGFKNMIPGESRGQAIELKNSSRTPAELFLYAEPAGEQAGNIGKLLREYAHIIVSGQAGNVVYEGPLWGLPDGESGMKNPISLGVFEAAQSEKLQVNLSLWSGMDNEFSELLASIKWVFLAQAQDDIPTGGPAVKPTAPERTTETTTAQEEASSAEDEPSTAAETTIISSETTAPNEPSKVETDVPNTGDESNILLYKLLMALSLLLLLLLILVEINARKRGDRAGDR